eukprot:21054_1
MIWFFFHARAFMYTNSIHLVTARTDGTATVKHSSSHLDCSSLCWFHRLNSQHCCLYMQLIASLYGCQSHAVIDSNIFMSIYDYKIVDRVITYGPAVLLNICITNLGM